MTAIPALMHATQVPRPFHTKGWVYEEKIDGWRMLAVKEAGRVRLVSRNGRDHTKRFHAIAETLAALKPKTLTLDGEVAVSDSELVARFEWLRHINHGDFATPPLFMVFDLLQLGEKDYRPEPLKVRRKALEKLVKSQKADPAGAAAQSERVGCVGGSAASRLRGDRGRRTRSRLTWPGVPSDGSR